MRDTTQIFIMVLSVFSMLTSFILIIRARDSAMKDFLRDLSGWLTVLALMLWMIVM